MTWMAQVRLRTRANWIGPSALATRPDHRHDAGLERLGKVSPSLDDEFQIGVDAWQIQGILSNPGKTAEIPTLDCGLPNVAQHGGAK